MTPQNPSCARIAIACRYLDEVRIRQAREDAPGSVSNPSFPAHRHLARLEEDRVCVSTQAPTVVQLFAERVLAPFGGPAVTVEIGGQEFEPCLLEGVESDGASPLNTTIVLHFRRLGGDRP